MSVELYWQWGLVIGSSIFLYVISPRARSVESFFSGVSKTAERPGFLMLTFSLVISWIFAKSIANAANLGMSFGFVGGFAYAVYYLSFLVAGVVIYYMRSRARVKSLHQFLQNKFGRSAIIVFSLVISIRLLNEVWSNTAVIGSYFGETGSPQYIAAVIVFTALTLAYSLKGGLRSSLITDMIQMGLFGILLFVVLGMIIPARGSLTPFISSGEWSMDAGLNLLFAAAIQVFSYPFHDPVMTDRGFISDTKTTLKSFIAAAIIGFFCILLFSFIGIYGGFLGLSGQAAVEVSKTFGLFMMLMTNFIMVTSAASTLDSTFSSVSKLAVVDLAGERGKITLFRGRRVMIITAVGGSLPLFFAPEIISATTISGTMVLGLAPVFIFWFLPAPKISFHLSVWTGITAGLVLTFGLLPESLYLSNGKYADLLAINIYAMVLCFAGYLVPVLLAKKSLILGSVKK
jgi:Na+/proline symporter